MGITDSKEQDSDAEFSLDDEFPDRRRELPNLETYKTNFDKISTAPSSMMDIKRGFPSKVSNLGALSSKELTQERSSEQINFESIKKSKSNVSGGGISSDQDFSQPPPMEIDGEHFWGKLPLHCNVLIIEFAINDLYSLIQVSNKWRQQIKKMMLLSLFPIRNKFEQKYGHIFDKVNCRLNFSRLPNIVSRHRKPNQKAKPACKLDLVISCIVKTNLENKAVMLSNSYKLAKRAKNRLYSNYLFDVVPDRQTREVWIHKEDRYVILILDIFLIFVEKQQRKGPGEQSYHSCQYRGQVRISSQLLEPGGALFDKFLQLGG